MFFDDPTNTAIVSTVAGVAGIVVIFVAGYVLVSKKSNLSSPCAK